MTESGEAERAGRSDLDWLLGSVVESGGGAVAAVILFGSQLSKASPTPHSAWDFVVIVDDYAPFHDALVRSGHHVRDPRSLDRLARRLPPSITAFSPTPEGVPVAKCAIIDVEGFERAMGPDSPDHFLKGRMVQQVRVEWARDEAIRDRIHEILADARSRVFDWAGPWLSTPMTPESVPAEMLAVSYRGEVRPENTGRVLEIVSAQRAWLTDAYTTVLAEAAEAGRLREVEGGYDWVEPPTAADERRVRRYFRRSKLRGILRWPKHMLTFNDWLTYIQRKAERRTGLDLTLSDAERRWPLLLLWPKVVKVLRARNRPMPPETE